MENKGAIVHNQSAHRFELAAGDALAFANYEMQGDTIVFTHTEVPEAMEGQGIAGRLARTALDYARERNLKVLARCRFIASWIERHPDYQDLLDKAS